MSIPFHRLAHSTHINPAKPARWWHPLTEIAVFVVAGLALTGLWSVVAYWLADLMMYIILMIPAAEELIFRAWLPQLIGTWVTSPWLPYLVSLPIFMIGHEYGIKGQIYVAVFAICAAILTHYTRGIEAAIVIHVVGNVVAFSLETIGVYESATSDAGSTWTAIACSVAVTVASTAVLLRMHRREYGRAFTNAPATNRPTITRPAGQPDAPRESAAMDAHVR